MFTDGRTDARFIAISSEPFGRGKKRISNTLICQAVQRCLSFQTVGIDSAAVYPGCLSSRTFFFFVSFFHFRFSNKYRILMAV